MISDRSVVTIRHMDVVARHVDIGCLSATPAETHGCELTTTWLCSFEHRFSFRFHRHLDYARPGKRKLAEGPAFARNDGVILDEAKGVSLLSAGMTSSIVNFFKRLFARRRICALCDENSGSCDLFGRGCDQLGTCFGLSQPRMVIDALQFDETPAVALVGEVSNLIDWSGGVVRSVDEQHGEFLRESAGLGTDVVTIEHIPQRGR